MPFRVEPLFLRPTRAKTLVRVLHSLHKKKKLPFGNFFFKTGMEGLEPPKCLDQNQVPYHLATSHWVYSYLTSSIWFVNIFKKFLLFLFYLFINLLFSFRISTYSRRIKKSSRIYQQIVLWCEILTQKFSISNLLDTSVRISVIF